MQANVVRLPMAHPGDLSALDRITLAEGVVHADEIVAVIGKTQGQWRGKRLHRGPFDPECDGLVGLKLADLQKT